MPVQNCFICGKVTSKHLFWFPIRKERCQQWIDNLQLNVDVKDVSHKKRICQDHFTDISFRTPLQTSLNFEALPTIINPLPLNQGFEEVHLLQEQESVTNIMADDADRAVINVPASTSSQAIHLLPLNQGFEEVHLQEQELVTKIMADDADRAVINVPASTSSQAIRAQLLSSNSYALRAKAKYINQLKSICKRKQKKIKDLLKPDVQSVIRNALKGCLNKTSLEFLLGQIRCSGYKPRGRRWTMNDKAVALSLYKRSPKGYRLLQSLTALPSRGTLLTLLSTIPMNPGICSKMFGYLEECVQEMPERDRTCSLIFDEMSLRQHLEYNHSKDVIKGFEEFGKFRGQKYANTALVFLLQGLRKQWKQPVAYYFVHSKMSSSNKKSIDTSYTLDAAITEVLDACQKIGFNIVATICDMGSNNVKALEKLGASYENPFFMYNTHLIYRFFDPPHLLKCTRNMFLKHSVRCKVNIGENEIDGNASIADVAIAVEHDKKNIFRTVPKITNNHLQPNSYLKMKVSLATQLLSHSVASLILHTVSQGILPNSAISTAVFIKLVDDLFDSFNGVTYFSEGGKTLKSAITPESPHIEFWCKMEKIINTWKYVGFRGDMPPSQKGWLSNIKAMKGLWNHLKSSHDFKFLKTRAINQDAIENMFGGLRSYCGNNVNPTTSQFVSGLKTHIINGLSNKSMQHYNCADDGGILLNNLLSFLQPQQPSMATTFQPEISSTASTSKPPTVVEDTFCISDINFDILNLGSANVYVSGFIAKRILDKMQCNDCSTFLQSSSDEWLNDFITFKEYDSGTLNKLVYPSMRLVEVMSLAVNTVEEILKIEGHVDGIGQHIKTIIKNTIDLTSISCDIHISEVQERLLKSICFICIPWFCTRRNREFILNSHSSKSKKTAILQHM